MTNDVLAELGTTAAALADVARRLTHDGDSDLRGLATMMDGAADAVLSAIRRYPATRRADLPAEVVAQARVFIAAAGSLVAAARDLGDGDVVAESCRALRQRRIDGEVAYQQAQMSLAGARDLHQRLRWAVERCGHAGRLLEGCCLPALRG